MDHMIYVEGSLVHACMQLAALIDLVRFGSRGEQGWTVVIPRLFPLAKSRPQQSHLADCGHFAPYCANSQGFACASASTAIQ